MKTDSQVDEIMARIPPRNRFNGIWCEATECFCLGCINRIWLRDEDVTKEEWLAWRDRQANISAPSVD